MAVLVEAISVVIRADALLGTYPGGLDAFKNHVPNKTMCADGELVRVGFMSPPDVQDFVTKIEKTGLRYLDNGAARDIVVVDQIRGLAVPCDWVEFGHIDLDDDPNKKIAACRLKGSEQMTLIHPDGWEFENSLSASYGFVPARHAEKSLTYLRTEDGLDVFHNELTGKEVYVGRTGSRVLLKGVRDVRKGHQSPR